MKESKGWEFLTAFEEIDEKYIYQAAKPWKENKIVIVQHYIRGVAACILLVAVIGVGLIHQKKVEAAWYKMTSLIGRILGIEKGTDEYVKAIQKTIEKNGIAVSLEEVAADEKSLWVAYSLTDENDENDISMNSVQAAVDGEALALERQYALNNSTGSEKTASKYFVAKFNRSKADRSQKFEIEIGTFQNENGQVEEKDAYEFSFTADPEVLEADTKEIDIQTSIPIEKNQDENQRGHDHVSAKYGIYHGRRTYKDQKYAAAFLLFSHKPFRQKIDRDKANRLIEQKCDPKTIGSHNLHIRLAPIYRTAYIIYPIEILFEN